MKILADIPAVRDACNQARADGRRVALVPTMGALHEGHLGLVDRAGKIGDFVVVSIFVNPTQFGPGEDLDRYPRDLEGDAEKLAARGANLIFTPTPETMYPGGHSTHVEVREITDGLCGASRPTHFRGVATVVCKLFNIIGPCSAVFGRKDFQQLQVIKTMVRDLDMPVEVIGAPTHREADGLAMSSRNAYLSTDDRTRGLAISQGLTAAHKLFREGERNVGRLRMAVARPVEAAADRVDYVSATSPDTLEPLTDDATASSRLLIAVAAHLGKTRLIDNTVLGEDDPP
ncbi:MAG: pantoate--beta-alanine ligase [Deltaproteobacteria bacterium]|nr:pantoate--beta-alanine ligase [Deltaproteobacteria bacterium]